MPENTTELPTRCAENMAEYWDFPCVVMGLHRDRWDDLEVAVTYGRRVGSLMNNVTLLRPLTSAEVEVSAARSAEFFGTPSPAPFSVNSFFPAVDFAPCGFSIDERLPVMVRRPGGRAPNPPAGLTIEEVADARSLRAFERVFIDGFPLVDFQPYSPGSMFDERILGHERFRLYVGWVSGEPVASATAFIGAGLIGVFNVATMPHVRGLGYGTALAWAATQADPGLPATLQATSSGQAIYRRMGYEEVGELVIWRPDGR